MKSFKKGLGVLAVCFALVLMAAPIRSEAAAPKLNKKTASVTVGKTVQLTVKNTKSKVKWSTSNKKIATVTSKGLVKGKKVGTATVTAKVGKKSLKCKVTVKVGLNKTKETLYIGDTSQLKLSGTSQKVKWSTSKKSVATVNSKGKVTAKKSGTATITAKLGKKSYKYKVTVKNIDVLAKTLTIKNAGCIDAFACKGSLKATSSNPSVAKVKVTSGMLFGGSIYVYGYKTGTAVITLTNTYDSDKVKVTVKVNKPASVGEQKVIDYLLVNGKDDGEGNLCITKEQPSALGKSTVQIAVSPLSDSLVFATTDMDKAEEYGNIIGLVFGMNGDGEEAKGFAMGTAMVTDKDGNGYMFATELKMATCKLTDEWQMDGMKFGYTGDAEEDARGLLRQSLTAWDELLKEKTGMTLKDIGFTSLFDGE